MKKEQAVTKNYFEKTLDRRLSQQTQVIITAVDGVLDKRLKGVGSEFKEVRLDIAHIGKKVDDSKNELKKDINNVQTLIDGYVKAQEDFKQEFVIMKEEVKQIKQVLKKKLGVEIQAI